MSEYANRMLRLVGCCLVGASLLLWGILRWTGGDLRAFLGAMAIWFVAFVGIAWHEAVITQRLLLEGDPGKLRDVAGEQLRQLRLPIRVGTLLLPGLWIGATAATPLLMAGLYLLVFRSVPWLTEHLPLKLPEDPYPRAVQPESLLLAPTLLLSGALVGFATRMLFL